ncbi:hypothetical protein GWI33_017659 [Rhynchophorus ferrugineus]|uniref:RNA polymerase Rpb4/RPC9 core domain-containing protein n=1 Tax=Rhynchophorus ferrugineus TaxID=354439 RepID=A0A834HWC4_RHYFE|nr:hypothetical protein GWI33_017659 [Rhynchophorus ferrugineus]
MANVIKDIIEEDATDLQFPKGVAIDACFLSLIVFENTKTLLITEVYMLLEHRKAQSEWTDDELEFSDVLMKTLIYADRFRKFENDETISAVKNLHKQKKFHKFELAAIMNSCPKTVEESKSLIFSLAGSFGYEELQTLLEDIQTKRSIQY